MNSRLAGAVLAAARLLLLAQGGGCCGVGEPDDRVLGGRAVGAAGYPWYVGLAVAPPPTRPGPSLGPPFRIACGGSLVSPRHVLTAAHCYGKDKSNDEMVSRYGLVYLVEYVCLMGDAKRGPQALTVRVHPLFDPETLANDIAVITLQRAVSYTPICLPAYRLPPEGNATVIGYGSMVLKRVYPCRLQEADLELIPRSKCLQTAIGVNVANLPGTLCAGRLQGGVDACDGDSGGPLQARDKNGRYVIRGIVSFGSGCGKKGVPGVYTDVSAYLNWIRDVVEAGNTYSMNEIRAKYLRAVNNARKKYQNHVTTQLINNLYRRL